MEPTVSVKKALVIEKPAEYSPAKGAAKAAASAGWGFLSMVLGVLAMAWADPEFNAAARELLGRWRYGVLLIPIIHFGLTFWRNRDKNVGTLVTIVPQRRKEDQDDGPTERRADRADT
jgi:hypothetical protein